MKTAVLIPCYKRPEYTELCMRALEKAQKYENVEFFLVDDGSKDGTDNLLNNTSLPKRVIVHQENRGLRNVIIQFFKDTEDFEYIVKMDNDCLVPSEWLNKLICVLKHDLVDIVSPNVLPSNAAFKVGKESDISSIRLSPHVGGLWCMKRSLIDDVQFEDIESYGIKGAFPVLQQIIVEKDPRIGWATNVNVEDMGHYSGKHEKHIKSQEHLEYSQEVGRSVSWA